MFDLKLSERVRLRSTDLVGGDFAIAWSDEMGQPGMPWSSGVLNLEHHPDLHPLRARGIGGNVGKYWKDQWLPQVRSPLTRPIRALIGLPWRLEQPEVPDWASLEDVRAARRQWELCQRVWHGWQSKRQTWNQTIREMVLTAQVAGFYWGEIVTQERSMELPSVGFPVRYQIPGLPRWRAPWSIQYWLTQKERPVGVIASFSQASDYDSGVGDSWVVIPWAKIVHVGAEQIGSALEGFSSLRSVNNLLEMLKDTYRLRALAIEVNGVGELFFKLSEGGVDAVDEEKLRDYIRFRKSAQVSGAVLPNGVEPHYGSPSATMPNLEPVVDGLTRDIMLGLDSEDRLIAVMDTGAYAARESASADARDQYDYLASELVAGPLEQCLEAAVRINFPADVAAGRTFIPRVDWGVAETRDMGDWVSTVALARQAGILDDPVIGPGVREQLDLPASGDVAGDGETLEDAPGPEDDPLSGQWVSPSAIAMAWGYAPGTVTGWAKKGLIRGRKIGPHWRIDASDVKRFLDQGALEAESVTPTGQEDANEEE